MVKELLANKRRTKCVHQIDTFNSLPASFLCCFFSFIFPFLITRFRSSIPFFHLLNSCLEFNKLKIEQKEGDENRKKRKHQKHRYA